jgi:hypothetical protein
MALADLVAESGQLIRWLDDRIDGLEVKLDDRARLAAACLDMALDYHKAIVPRKVKLSSRKLLQLEEPHTLLSKTA